MRDKYRGTEVPRGTEEGRRTGMEVDYGEIGIEFPTARQLHCPASCSYCGVGSPWLYS